eukprot:c32224_g1_i1.p1 GENE.c32224_g1_i1~~c32224_g1_i1.p1  ORF type:complete len:432 (-),score=63.17 c32224_g1_i1:138-1433(-)
MGFYQRSTMTTPSFTQFLGVSGDDPAKVFDVIEKLGEGNYGSVYKCKRLTDSGLVAMKVVPVDSEYESLMREIEVLRQCTSPYIVAYYGSFFKDGDLWIAMEYCALGSVGDMMEICSRTLTESQIAAITSDALKGLAYLHSRKIIHRDIKAGNLLMDEKGHVKLADFGVSAQLSNTWSKRKSVIGTPFWMAPEVIQQSDYNGRADVWSLGITCIEMAEGRPPYADVHPMRAIFIIPAQPPPSLTSPSKWSPEFNDFISLCLSKEPSERPTPEALLKHPFITRWDASHHDTLVALVNECLEPIREFREAESESEDEISKSHSSEESGSESGSDEDDSDEEGSNESDGKEADVPAKHAPNKPAKSRAEESLTAERQPSLRQTGLEDDFAQLSVADLIAKYALVEKQMADEIMAVKQRYKRQLDALENMINQRR